MASAKIANFVPGKLYQIMDGRKHSVAYKFYEARTNSLSHDDFTVHTANRVIGVKRDSILS